MFAQSSEITINPEDVLSEEEKAAHNQLNAANAAIDALTPKVTADDDSVEIQLDAEDSALTPDGSEFEKFLAALNDDDQADASVEVVPGIPVVATPAEAPAQADAPEATVPVDPGEPVDRTPVVIPVNPAAPAASPANPTAAEAVVASPAVETTNSKELAKKRHAAVIAALPALARALPRVQEIAKNSQPAAEDYAQLVVGIWKGELGPATKFFGETPFQKDKAVAVAFIKQALHKGITRAVGNAQQTEKQEKLRVQGTDVIIGFADSILEGNWVAPAAATPEATPATPAATPAPVEAAPPAAVVAPEQTAAPEQAPQNESKLKAFGRKIRNAFAKFGSFASALKFWGKDSNAAAPEAPQQAQVQAEAPATAETLAPAEPIAVHREAALRAIIENSALLAPLLTGPMASTPEAQAFWQKFREEIAPSETNVANRAMQELFVSFLAGVLQIDKAELAQSVSATGIGPHAAIGKEIDQVSFLYSQLSPETTFRKRTPDQRKAIYESVETDLAQKEAAVKALRDEVAGLESADPRDESLITTKKAELATLEQELRDLRKKFETVDGQIKIVDITVQSIDDYTIRADSRGSIYVELKYTDGAGSVETLNIALSALGAALAMARNEQGQNVSPDGSIKLQLFDDELSLWSMSDKIAGLGQGKDPWNVEYELDLIVSQEVADKLSDIVAEVDEMTEEEEFAVGFEYDEVLSQIDTDIQALTQGGKTYEDLTDSEKQEYKAARRLKILLIGLRGDYNDKVPIDKKDVAEIKKLLQELHLGRTGLEISQIRTDAELRRIALEKAQANIEASTLPTGAKKWLLEFLDKGPTQVAFGFIGAEALKYGAHIEPYQITLAAATVMGISQGLLSWDAPIINSLNKMKSWGSEKRGLVRKTVSGIAKLGLAVTHFMVDKNRAYLVPNARVVRNVSLGATVAGGMEMASQGFTGNSVAENLGDLGGDVIGMVRPDNAAEAVVVSAPDSGESAGPAGFSGTDSDSTLDDTRADYRNGGDGTSGSGGFGGADEAVETNPRSPQINEVDETRQGYRDEAADATAQSASTEPSTPNAEPAALDTENATVPAENSQSAEAFAEINHVHTVENGDSISAIVRGEFTPENGYSQEYATPEGQSVISEGIRGLNGDINVEHNIVYANDDAVAAVRQYHPEAEVGKPISANILHDERLSGTPDVVKYDLDSTSGRLTVTVERAGISAARGMDTPISGTVTFEPDENGSLREVGRTISQPVGTP